MAKLDFKTKTHLDTLRAALLPELRVTKQSEWITRNIRLGQKPFSFKDHEYQKEVIDTNALETVVCKPSQVGFSEVTVIKMLAYLLMNPGKTAIYLLMTASYATRFSATRVSTRIAESPNISDIIVPGKDSSELKQFTNGSSCWFKGANTESAAVSIPASMLLVDEYDFYNDLSILSSYTSRLSHEKYPQVHMFSTPTLPNFGISAEILKTKQRVEITRCNRCNHTFLPDYYSDVILPGFNGDFKKTRKKTKTKSLAHFNYNTQTELDNYDLDCMYLKCPKCGRKVDQSVKYREWIWKNSDSKSDRVGFFVTPFSAPEFITLKRLIQASVKYRDIGLFANFELGLPYASSENTLTPEELEKVFLPNIDTIPYAVMGLDLGSLSYVTVAVPGNDRSGLRAVHVEGIPLHRLDDRLEELKRKYRVILTVSDALPYTSSVIKWQKRDPNLWGCVFTSSRNVELFTLVEKENDETKATFGMRQINANRDKMLDHVVDLIRSESITFNEHCGSDTGENPKPEVFKHLQDLKRRKVTDKSGENSYKWVKSAAGNDHIFFSLLYCTLALYMAGQSAMSAPLPSLFHTVNTERNRKR